MRTRQLIAVLALATTAAAAVALLPSAAAGRTSGSAVTGASPADVAQGEHLYGQFCARCHGANGAGIDTHGTIGGGRAARPDGAAAALGPSLRGVGALAADFYLRTGYMPLAALGRQPRRTRVLLAGSEITQLIAYVASLGDGPAIPHAAARAGQPLAGAAPLRRPLRRLPSDRWRGRVRHRRGAAAAARRTARRRSPRPCASGPTSCRASRGRRSRDRQLDSIIALRPVHEAPRRPRRLVDRPPRPGARGPRDLVPRRRGARRDLRRHRKEAQVRDLQARRDPARRPRAAGPPPARSTAPRGRAGAHRARRPGRPARRARGDRPPAPRRGARRSASSSSTRSTGCRHQTQLLGACLGLSLLCIAAALIVVGQAARRDRGARRAAIPPQEHPEEQRSDRPGRSRRAVAASRAGACSGCARRSRGGCARALRSRHRPHRSGPVFDMQSLLSNALAARPTPRRRERPPLPRRRHRDRRCLHGLPGGRRQGEARLAARRRAAPARRSRACRRRTPATPRTASSPTPRSAPTQAARSPSTARRSSTRRARAGARLPLPLLDLRSRQPEATCSRAPPGASCRCCRSDDRPQGRPARRRQLRRPRRRVLVGRAAPEAEHVIRRLVRYVDQRSGTAPLLRKQLRYLFPDHWSFLLGEVALYAFLVLVATGTYLALFFNDSTAQVVYHGPYAPLHGQHMTEAYRSVLDISTSVKAGLLIRQTHHWAADVFIAAIVLHLLRVFFTGAYRKPREVTYWIGLTMLDARAARGLPRLLARRRPALGHGARDRQRASRSRSRSSAANLAALALGRPVPGRLELLPAHVHRSTSSSSRPDRRSARRRTSHSSRCATTPSSARPARDRAADRRRAGVPGAGAALARAAVRGRRACSSCSAASSRSTRSGCGGRSTPTPRRTAPSRTGTSAG